jgi:GntR family transcriptional regulator/MocR family aminotransferase
LTSRVTNQPVDLLVSVARGHTRTLGRQIEDQLRDKIREHILRPGSRVPSTRDLATELGVSRPIVVDAYSQLAAEGYLVLRQGARPRVADCIRPARQVAAPTPVTLKKPLYDFCAGVPDLSSFPRASWLRSVREALRTMPDVAFGYGERHGSEVLRVALSDYLGRVRGVVSDPARVVVTSGWAQGRRLACSTLVEGGARRLGVEDPCFVDARESAERMGLELVPIPVDEHGIQVEALDRANVDAVMVTPAHQFPSGAVLSGERRAALLAWLRRRDAVVIEDDYDAEFRYDRAPVGALQALDPGRIIYAGTASKTLAPALRLGWLVVPPRLLARVMREQALTDIGCPRIDQHVFADFLARGELDRHLRRMRAKYRARRDALVSAVNKHLPGAEICGIAAGLHATVKLPAGHDERRIVAEAERRGVAVTTVNDYAFGSRRGPVTLLLGYATHAEPVIRAGVKELAKAIEVARRGAPERRQAR